MDVAVVASTGRTRKVAVEGGNRRTVEGEHQVHRVRQLHLGLPRQRQEAAAGVGSMDRHSILHTELAFRSNNEKNDTASREVGGMESVSI